MESMFSHIRAEAGIPETIDPDHYQSVLQVFAEAVKNYPECRAFTCMGCSVTYRQLDQLSTQFAAYLQQHTPLQQGDRFAVQMPNLLQYPVALFGLFKAGLVVVNTNPLYTERELRHQFKDSGAKGLLVLANMASVVEPVLADTDIKTVLVTEVADLHPLPKRLLINTIAKYVKKMVPSFHIPQAVSFRQALNVGAASHYQAVTIQRDDVAVLQYTGGTTGLSKGAMLSHRNLCANMQQSKPLLLLGGLKSGEDSILSPLPLYHIYAFTVHCMVAANSGLNSILIPNPRDIPGFVKLMQKTEFSAFVGLNTLFVALMKHPDFTKIDFSKLILTLSGGMALTRDAAEKWKQLTGCSPCEGYGLTETSPIACANPPTMIELGSIGIPMPSTEAKIIDGDGNPIGEGESGELCIRGPQVMQGYWQKPEETANVIDAEGWFHTGDMAEYLPTGRLHLVDRKKDMICVSGFNVYPNELENVLTEHPAVIECAAIGIPDERSGEVVKMFAVKADPNITEKDLIEHCRKNLTAYKVPKHIEFRDELPKTNVGKILRRALRDEAVA